MGVLVVGSVAIDDVTTPTGHGERVQGGSASYFSIAASHHTDVSVIAVVGEDYPQAFVDRLASRDVDVSGIERVAGESFYWRGSYDRELKQATTHDTRLGVFETFQPKLAESHRTASHLFLANIHPSLQLSVLDQMEKPAVTALDTMNLWITSTRELLAEVVSRVDIVLMNDEELRLYTGSDNLLRAARLLLDEGPTVVVIKKGEHGAFLRTRDLDFALPSFPTEGVEDPTGAGDSFAGGFVGTVAAAGDLEPATLRTAVANGIATASFTVEGFSVDGILSLDATGLAQRRAALQVLTRFE